MVESNKNQVAELLESLSEWMVMNELEAEGAHQELENQFKNIFNLVETIGGEALPILRVVLSQIRMAIELGIPNQEQYQDYLISVVSGVTAIIVDGQSASAITILKPPFAMEGQTEEVENPDPDKIHEYLDRHESTFTEIESQLLELEKKDDLELLNDVRRQFHTLKGDAGILGLSEVQRVCHHAEESFSEDYSKFQIQLLLAVKDWLLKVFDYYLGKTEEYPPAPDVEEYLEKSRLAQKSEKVVLPDDFVLPAEYAEAIPADFDEDLFVSFFEETKEHLQNIDEALFALEENPLNREALDLSFRAFHTVKGVSAFLNINYIKSFTHDVESLLDRVRQGEMKLTGSILDLLFDSVAVLRILIQNLKVSAVQGTPLEACEKLPLICYQVQRMHEEGEEAAQESQGKQKKKTKNIDKEDSLDLTANKKTSDKKIRNNKESVKVDAYRLDLLIEMIGELVIAEAMVTESDEIRALNSTKLVRHVGQLGKITRDLQELATSLRMVPLKTTFQKMARLVRDTSKKTGKLVVLETDGEDVELDKTLVDRIYDPLVHLVRNAIDHGIEESPADREQLGKPEVGQLSLRAYHKGGAIYVELEDDGRGLNKQAILERAFDKGIIDNSEHIEDERIHQLIFHPGFSTAKVVSDVSGRGVGMDVVKKSIEAMRGVVEIQSTPGKGSIFSLKLPLTLAIIDGMTVMVGTERYIIPTQSIVRTLSPEEDDISDVLTKQDLLFIDGVYIPLFYLGQIFGVPGTFKRGDGVLIIIEEEGKRVAVCVDYLIGQQQIVIKTLGESMKKVQGISGGAIMPDGKVGLIVEVSELVKLAVQNDFSSSLKQAPKKPLLTSN